MLKSIILQQHQVWLLLTIVFPHQELKKVMDKVHELDTKCAGIQTALEVEKSRNAELVGEVNSNKSKVKKN